MKFTLNVFSFFDTYEEKKTLKKLMNLRYCFFIIFLGQKKLKEKYNLGGFLDRSGQTKTGSDPWEKLDPDTSFFF